MTRLYRDILKNAWKLCVRHRFLWLFGLFAALLGNGGEYEILFRNLDAASGHQAFVEQLQRFSQTGVLNTVVTNIASMFTNYTALTLIWSLTFLAIFVFLVWMVIVSQTALIDSAARLNSKRSASIESGFKVGKEKFARVFLLNIVSKVIIYGLLMVVGVPLGYLFITQKGLAWTNAFTITSFVILVPIAIIISFIIKYALAFVVLKDQRAGEAFKSGWKLFWNNWLISIEMAIILFVFTMIAGLAMFLLVSIVALPFILLTFLFILASLAGATEIIVIIGSLLALAVIFLVGSFVGAFQWSAWTLLFQRLTKGKELSKLVKIFHKKTV